MDSKVLDALRDLILGRVEDEASSRLRPGPSLETLSSQFDLSVPGEGRSVTEVIGELGRIVEATPTTSGARFFNQLFGGRIEVATAAEMLTAVLNNSMYTFKIAGVQVLIEREVISKMCSLAGYGDGEGIFCPGGSLSNLSAMVCARNQQAPDVRERGLDGRVLTAYTSDQGHYSIAKNAGIIGIGRENVRAIPSDDRGRMRANFLKDEIAKDLDAGCTPFFINATAGTTVLGAFDPISEIAEVARELEIWLHVDGAFGGTALLSASTRNLLDGVELSDSMAWCAHKMMGVPLPASALLMRQKDRLRKNFDERADYLFQADVEELNPGHQSIQCGRRNDALKVWAAWRFYGEDGYAKRVDKQMELARYATEYVKNDPELELCVEPELINVCFRVLGKDSAQICEALDKAGEIKVGYGSFKGESWIRLVCVNPELHKEDIEEFFKCVIDAGRKLH